MKWLWILCLPFTSFGQSKEWSVSQIDSICTVTPHNSVACGKIRATSATVDSTWESAKGSFSISIDAFDPDWKEAKKMDAAAKRRYQPKSLQCIRSEYGETITYSDLHYTESRVLQYYYHDDIAFLLRIMMTRTYDDGKEETFSLDMTPKMMQSKRKIKNKLDKKLREWITDKEKDILEHKKEFLQ